MLPSIGIATLLMIGAVLLGRSFVNLTRVDLGFQSDRVLTLRVSLPDARYPERSKVAQAFDQMLARIDARPAVDAAGVIQLLPLTGGNWNPGVAVDGAAPADQYPEAVNWRTVSPGYFRAMGIPLQRGRAFTAADRATSQPVAVVNESFARLVLRADPIGRRVRTGFEPAGTWVTIVGVVGDVRQHAVEQAPNPEMYRPFAQHPVGGMHMMVRANGDLRDLAGDVRAIVAGLDRDIVISGARADVGRTSVYVSGNAAATPRPSVRAAPALG